MTSRAPDSRATTEFPMVQRAGLHFLRRMAALGVATLIGSAIAGVLVDRFGPRKVLMFGELLFVPVAIGMIFADTIPALTIASFALGLFGAPVFTAISAFGPFLTDDPERLARINSMIEGAAWAAFVIGPAMGAIIAASVGLDGIFVLDAGPNIDSSFHIVGTIFDTVIKEGVALLKGNTGSWGAQAMDLSPAQGGIVEFTTAEDGLYPIVTHAFNFVGRGALGLVQAGDGDPLN